MRHALSLAPLALALLVGCGKDYPTFTPVELDEALDADWGTWLSMDVTPDGRIAATYYNKDQGAIGFAVASGPGTGDLSWHHEEVDGYANDQGLDVGDRGLFTSMRVAPDGTVWAAYRDQSNKVLRAAHRTAPGVWESAVADAGSGMSPDTGYWASLDLDAEGNPVVAHYDAGSGALRVARYAEGGWSAETAWTGSAWTGTAADGTPLTRPASVGQFAKLLIHDGTEYIAFYDAASQSLELVEGGAGAWTHSTVYSASNGGQWPSLLVDGDALYVAFHELDSQDLMLATRTGGGAFQVRTLDDGAFRGADSELYLKDGALSALYFDGQENDLLRLTDGTPAVIDTLGGAEGAEGFHNEVVQVGDALWAGSYSYTTRSVVLYPL